MERDYRYLYAVVTSNGAGVHATYKRCNVARLAMARIAERWSIPGTVFEIERIQQFSGGRRYQMRRGSRWVEWDPHKDHEKRKPDWMAVSPKKQKAA